MRSAALFDLDGTLVDADHFHFEAWRDRLAAYGVALDLDGYNSRIMGRKNTAIVADLLPRLSVEDGAAISDAKEAAFRTLAAHMDPAAGLLDFLDWLDQHDVPIAVVTNAPRANAEHSLGALALAERFAEVVIGDELAEAKPHPLPYLTGLERLGGEAARSLAFEDSPSGIQAALAAGLAVVGLTTSLDADRLLQEGVGLAIQDFADPRLIRFAAARLGIPLPPADEVG